jgi:hypothetical protein
MAEAPETPQGPPSGQIPPTQGQEKSWTPYLLSAEQATGQTPPQQVDFADFMEKAQKSNPQDFNAYMHLSDLSTYERGGKIGGVVIPSAEETKKRYPDMPEEQFTDYYGKLTSMYDQYQKNKHNFVGPNPSATHWTNKYGKPGFIDLQDYVLRSASWTGKPQYKTQQMPGYYNNGDVLWGEEEIAFASGKYVDATGNIQDLDSRPDAGDRLAAHWMGLRQTDLSVDNLNTEDGTIPFYRERDQDERLTETNLPTGLNVDRGSNSWAQDFFGSAAAGWPSEFVYGGLKFGMDLTKLGAPGGFANPNIDRSSTTNIRGRLSDLVDSGKVSMNAADLMLRGMSRDQLSGMSEMGDVYAKEALDAMDKYDSLENDIYTQGLYDRVSDNLGAKAFALDYVSDREVRDHGFTGGADGFNLADFSANVSEGLAFLAPQMMATRIASAAALSSGLYNVSAKAFTKAGMNMIRTVGAGTLAAQMGGLTEMEAIRNGIDAPMAALIGAASLPITYGTEKLLGANWMAKWYGNTYYRETTQKEISEAVRAVTASLGLDPKNLTAEEAKVVGREVGAIVNKKLFGQGGKFSMKKGTEAARSGLGKAVRGFPYAVQAANNLIDGMPGFAQAGLTEMVQEGSEEIGYSFIERLHDKFLAEEHSYKGKGQYGTEIGNEEWWDRVYQSFLGGAIVGGIAGMGIKGKREITESLLGLIANGDIDKAKEIVDQMHKDGLFGYSHLGPDGSVLTQDDLATGIRSMDQEIAERLKGDIDLMNQMIDDEGLRGQVDDQAIQGFLRDNAQKFHLLKNGLGILYDRKKKQEELQELTKQMSTASQENKPGLQAKITSLSNQIDDLNIAYNDIVNGNAARGIGLTMYGRRLGIDRKNLDAAKIIHKYANERYEIASKKFNDMLNETKQVRTENSQKIRDIIKQVQGIANNVGNPTEIYAEIVKLSKNKKPGNFEESDIAELQKSLKEAEGGLIKNRASQGDIGEEEAEMEIGQSDEYGALLSAGQDEGSPTGEMREGVAKPPNIEKIIVDEFSKMYYERNGSVNIMDEMSTLLQTIKMGEVNSNMLHKATFYENFVASKELALNDSINGLNKIDPKYSFVYALGDVNIPRDASKTRLDKDLESKIRSEIEKVRQFAEDIKREILKNHDIRQERSNKFLVDSSIVNMNIIRETLVGNKVSDAGIDVSRKYKQVEMSLSDITKDFLANKIIPQDKYDELDRLMFELMGEMHVWFRQDNKGPDIIKNALAHIANVHKINRFNRYENAAEASYGAGSQTDISGASRSSNLSDVMSRMAGIINRDGDYITSKYPREHAVYAKTAIDLLNTMARIDVREVRHDLVKNEIRTPLNYQQEQVLAQLTGFLDSPINIINGSYKSLLTYDQETSQSYPSDVNGEKAFFNKAIHISGNAGSGKTSIIISNAMKTLSRRLGRKVKAATVAPGIFNLNELTNAFDDTGGGGSTYVDTTMGLIGELDGLLEKDFDVIIIDESHNIGKDSRIKEILDKANTKNVKLILMGDNRQMPSLEGESALIARSFLVHPAFKYMERTQPMYEIYRSGNAEIASLQDDIGNYIEMPKGDNFPHFTTTHEYKFNENKGVEFIDIEPIQRLALELQAGKDFIGIVPGDVEREAAVQSLMNLGLDEATASEKIKTLSPDKTIGGPSVSILGGRAPNVAVLTKPNEIRDFRMHARFLLTAASRSQQKVILFGDPTMSVTSNDILELSIKPNAVRYSEWLKAMALTELPSDIIKEPIPTPDSKVHKYDLGYRYEKPDGSRYEITQKVKDGTYIVRLSDPANAQLVGPDISVDGKEIETYTTFSRGDKFMGPIKLDQEWEKGNGFVYNMTMLDQSSVFTQEHEAIRDGIIGSKYGDAIRKAFNELSPQEQSDILKSNFSKDIDDHILNQARYYVRYAIINSLPSGAPVTIEYHAERKYLGGKSFKQNLEIHVNLESIESRLPEILSNVGINTKNGLTLSNELNFDHIGNLPDPYGVNANRMAPGMKQYLLDLLDNRQAGMVTLGGANLQIPETTDKYDSPVIPPFHDPLDKKGRSLIPFNSLVSRLRSMGEDVDGDSIEQESDNTYTVKIRRLSMVPGKTVKSSTIRLYPKNIFSDKKIGEAYLDKLIFDAKEMISSMSADNDPKGEIFRTSFYRFLNFNKKNIADQIKRETRLGNILDKYLYAQVEEGKIVGWVGKRGRYTNVLRDKDIKELTSVVNMLEEIKLAMPSFTKEALYAHLPREINRKTDTTYLSLIDADRNYAKHTLTWIKIKPAESDSSGKETSSTVSGTDTSLVNTGVFEQIDNIKEDITSNAGPKAELQARLDNLLMQNPKIAEIDNNFQIVVDLLKSENRLEVKC